MKKIIFSLAGSIVSAGLGAGIVLLIPNKTKPETIEIPNKTKNISETIEIPNKTKNISEAIEIVKKEYLEWVAPSGVEIKNKNRTHPTTIKVICSLEGLAMRDENHIADCFKKLHENNI